METAKNSAAILASCWMWKIWCPEVITPSKPVPWPGSKADPARGISAVYRQLGEGADVRTHPQQSSLAGPVDVGGRREHHHRPGSRETEQQEPENRREHGGDCA